MRGDVYELSAPREVKGHEQAGKRYGVVVQSDEMLLSTVVVAPTSTSAPERSWRPEIVLLRQPTKVLVEQIRTVDPQRLGKLVAHLSLADMQAIDRALKDVLGLR